MVSDKMSNQEQPVVLVTGGALRLGAKIVLALHQRGYRLIIHYRLSQTAASQLCEQLNSIRPHSAAMVQADFDQFSQIAICIEQAFSVWQRLDGIINNASSFFPTVVGETTFQQWQQLLNSNLMAPYFLVQAALPYLQMRKAQTQVINIVDVHGERPLKGYGVYSIAKAGLMMLTKTLAKELGPQILVNAIAPGITLWPVEQDLPSEKRQQLVERTVLKHSVHSEDIVNAILFLLNQSSITGEVIHIDCGRLLK